MFKQSRQERKNKIFVRKEKKGWGIIKLATKQLINQSCHSHTFCFEKEAFLQTLFGDVTSSR